jgi:LPXTG-motif cell wall-anchored protein
MRRSATVVATLVVLVFGVGMPNGAQAQEQPTTTSLPSDDGESVQDCVDPENPQGGFVPCEDLATTTTSLPSDDGESVQDCVDPENPQGGFVPCEDLATTTTIEDSSGTTSTTSRGSVAARADTELPRTGASPLFLAGIGLSAMLGGAVLSRTAHRRMESGRH